MKVQIIEVCEAYKAIVGILREPVPVKTGIAFYRMNEKLREVFDYAVMEEKKAQEKYKPEISENGRLKFDSPESAKEYSERINEIFAEETDVDVQPIDISNLGDDIKINLKALEKFITF